MAIEILCQTFGRPFEPYIEQVLSDLLVRDECFMSPCLSASALLIVALWSMPCRVWIVDLSSLTFLLSM